MYILTEEEKQKIQLAVEKAEKKTSGEIVPYLVQQSDVYWEAFFKSSLFFNIFTILFFFTIYELQNFGILSIWSKWNNFLTISHMSISIFIATIFGFVICYIPFIKRFFTGKYTIENRVYKRAMQAFLEKEVFKTKNRTGVLIFISLLEHRVVVLGDSGINQKVSKEDWEEIVRIVIEGIKNKTFVSGIIKAIEKSGELLEKSGLAISKEDINELPDSITESEK